MATTVDHVSNGRLEMGIGTSWNAAAFAMLGMPFADGAAERAARLGEACAVLKALWTETRATFDGRYYQLRDAISEPKPLQKPHPPITIGASGKRRALHEVARHADVWN